MRIGTEGDAGDSIILMGLISQLPDGPHDLVLQQSAVTKSKTPEQLADFHRIFSPLAESQSYIKSCTTGTLGSTEWDSGGFRGAGLHNNSETLFQAVKSHLIASLGIGHNLTSDKPWLKVEPSKRTEGRVIIARSDRYRNDLFPWDAVVKFYGSQLLFIGTPTEHGRFCNEQGKVEYFPTQDLLEAAQAIAGSLLFIGNQSSPLATAEGLKHPSIAEVCLTIADVIYKRENAQWCYDGTVTLPGFGKPSISTKEPPDLGTVSTNVTPPKMWQFQGATSVTFKGLKDSFLRTPEWSGRESELEDAIKLEQLNRVPKFYSKNKRGFHLVKQALVAAGYTV